MNEGNPVQGLLIFVANAAAGGNPVLSFSVDEATNTLNFNYRRTDSTDVLASVPLA
jgi:hypothetical protein